MRDFLTDGEASKPTNNNKSERKQQIIEIVSSRKRKTAAQKNSENARKTRKVSLDELIQR